MALISPFTIIRAVSLFHLTAAYFFLTAPRMLADQNIVYIIGESIRVVRGAHLPVAMYHTDNATQPHVTSLDKPNDASAFIAVILAFFAIGDLTGASLSEEIALEYWLSNVPVRLLFLFGLTGYVYLFKDDGIFGSQSMLRKTGPGDMLRTSLVFTWAFMETATWFWVSVDQPLPLLGGH